MVVVGALTSCPWSSNIEAYSYFQNHDNFR
jgi:hypothetical protein